MATKEPSVYSVIVEKTDPHVQVDGKPLVVSTSVVTVEAKSEADAKKAVETGENEAIIGVSGPT